MRHLQVGLGEFFAFFRCFLRQGVERMNQTHGFFGGGAYGHQHADGGKRRFFHLNVEALVQHGLQLVAGQAAHARVYGDFAWVEADAVFFQFVWHHFCQC